ncbi:hypothetical protein KFK14_09340 [Sphingobium phenoxybenzoativorans]|jgi:hypothetical protein|uniref:Uncharacterized protein n=1 Tax=Sphingobium phenoxybenzoativorans TaxID=1592790 RepID=A0A975KA14_9SPHN|nr:MULTISPECIES: hypothetical protein [Sphingobium]QUT07574.1 hypothetical protein KFK14_09340 [Sphingobium phenoxybenzoativorans]
MADSYVQGSFAFTCTHEEMALIEEAFQASYDLEAGDTPTEPTPEFLAAFPPVSPDKLWSGFFAIFPDPDFPNFGVDFEGGNSQEQPQISTVIFYSTTDFQPDPLAALIQRCCQTTLHDAPIGFEWACSCSKPRIGEFGGGACAIFADRIVFDNTAQMLERALSSVPNDALPPGQGHWDEFPEHPLADWQAEVANGDTRLGYHAWAAVRAA